MEEISPLIKVLIDNKQKILDSKKYNEVEFDEFIYSLMQAENERQKVLKKIEELGSIDIQKLKDILKISEHRLIYDIEYLKELGLLEFIGEISEFYQSIEEKNEKEGLFPNVSIIRDKKICSGCGLCVSICPTNAINFLNDVLNINDDLCINCGLCYACCHRSFFPRELKDNQEKLDTDIKYLKEFNNYREIYSAQTKDNITKEIAQDWEIVTTLLKIAFKQNIIDAAILIGTTEKPNEPLPFLIQNEEDLFKKARIVYNNANLLKILQNSKRFKKVAVVGTPCIMEALKKISIYPLNKPFYDNIALKIGSFCMNHSLFGCFFCDDLTAELSDISIGSIGSERGWSTVIARTSRGANLFQQALDLKLIEKKIIEEDSKNFNTLSKIAKSKLKMYKEIPRQKMIEQDPKVRRNNFLEVPKGYTLEMVKLETQRCLQCGIPLCIEGCPVNVDIPKFIRLLRQEKFSEAINNVKTYNLLPAICGRVCPQEIQCEQACLLGSVSNPIAIGNLERFIADWDRKSQVKACPDCQAPKNIKVAIIGAGPAGLTCAGELLMRGYDVTIFEAFHTGGGVLVYGIPEFRLPKEIVREEIETLKMLGSKIEYNKIIGKIMTIEDLKSMGFKAFFIGVGAGLPTFIKVSGLSLNGVLTANEFLTRANLMKAYKFPEYDTPIKIGKIVTVLGGGNVAMDSARVALRLGAERVIVVYRRSEKEMPARRAEYHHAIEEGIEFQFLTNPVSFIGDENENVKQMEVIKMRLGELDDSGRRRPIPIEGSEYKIDTDTIIIAIGTKANPILTNSIPELKLNKWGYIETNEQGKTNLEGVYAGGDIVTGSATVISAMGAGKRAATEIDNYLTKKRQ